MISIAIVEFDWYKNILLIVKGVKTIDRLTIFIEYLINKSTFFRYFIYCYCHCLLMKISNQMTKVFLLAMTVAIAGITVIATSLAPSTVFANVYFVTNMTGQEEVPPVDTQAVGEAILTQDLPQNQTMHYYVNVTGIQGVTQGHIHSGAEGGNGPIVVTLFSFDSPQNEVLQYSNFTASNLEGPMQGKTMQDLIGAMKNGTTYINVHTEQNPNGEIRGQLMNVS
jgi:hypothetical protein